MRTENVNDLGNEVTVTFTGLEVCVLRDALSRLKRDAWADGYDHYDEAVVLTKGLRDAMPNELRGHGHHSFVLVAETGATAGGRCTTCGQGKTHPIHGDRA